MTLNYIVFNKNEIYRPISFTGKLSFDYGLLSKTKFNLEDLHINIKQCILIFMENYIIWSHNLILLLMKKELYLVKFRLWASMKRKVSAANGQFISKWFFGVIDFLQKT